jgi:hypothetical protein
MRMKMEFLPTDYCKTTMLGLLLSAGLFAAISASAQNLVKNPGFESAIGTNALGNAIGGANFPLGITTGTNMYDPSWRSTNNWMIAYEWGGPGDLELKDRCDTPNSGSWSGKFRSAHDKLGHAYYTQIITNLQAGHTYLASGYMKEDRFKAWKPRIRIPTSAGCNLPIVRRRPPITPLRSACITTNAAGTSRTRWS